MNLDRLEAGVNIPHDIHVVIEIPALSAPVKYEMNKQVNGLMVNRFLSTAMYYPCDYGFIPHTLAEDGDPLDVLVITPHPLFSNSIILCRPIGMLKMTDESGPDTKVLAVPADRVSANYQHIQSPDDLDKSILDKIAHFFTHYKDLEAGKWSKVGGWDDAATAKSEILASIERYKQHKHSLQT